MVVLARDEYSAQLRAFYRQHQPLVHDVHALTAYNCRHAQYHFRVRCLPNRSSPDLHDSYFHQPSTDAGRCCQTPIALTGIPNHAYICCLVAAYRNSSSRVDLQTRVVPSLGHCQNARYPAHLHIERRWVHCS